MTDKTITVNGRGTVRLAPDLVKLTLAVTATDADYAQAVRKAEADAKKVLAALAGIAPDLRSASLRVEPAYETVQEQGVPRRRQSGFTATRRLRAELSADPALLADAVKAIYESGASPALSVEYALTDAEGAQRRAAALAVADARARAEALAEAAGVKTGAVRSVTCGSQGVIPAARMLAMHTNDAAELAPEEIEFAEDVCVVFDIV